MLELAGCQRNQVVCIQPVAIALNYIKICNKVQLVIYEIQLASMGLDHACPDKLYFHPSLKTKCGGSFNSPLQFSVNGQNTVIWF